MKQFGTDAVVDFDEQQPLLHLGRAKLFHLVRQRNAWWSTTVHHTMQAQPTVHLNVNDAALSAENLRKPGNTFRIDTVPALVMFGTTDVVVAVDQRSPVPFSMWTGRLWNPGNVSELPVPGLPISAYTRSLGSYSQPYWRDAAERWEGANWLRRMSYEDFGQKFFGRSVHLPRRPPAPADAGYPVYKSFAQGTRYYLGWERLPGQTSTRGTGAALRDFVRYLRLNPEYYAKLRETRALWMRGSGEEPSAARKARLRGEYTGASGAMSPSNVAST